MKSMVRHFWLQGPDGHFDLYEADYHSYSIREGVLCYRMLSLSERLCSCSERELHERQLAATLN